MSLTLDPAIATARLRVVEDHIRFECAHELDSLMSTFGAEPEWHDKAAQQVLFGLEAIRRFYTDLFRGFPDFSLNIRQRHVAQDSVVVEGILGGTQTGEWLGIEPTGKSVAVPFCAIFTFSKDDHLKSEIVYFDRLSLLAQLGVIHLPS